MKSLIKTLKLFIGSMLILTTLFINSCGESMLEPEIYSSTAPDNLFNSLKGVEAVLYGAHAEVANMQGNTSAQLLAIEESMTDIGFATAGAIANYLTQFQDFILDGVGDRKSTRLNSSHYS